ncbi:cobalt-precorrin-5B (C(1))-methyltransferase [Aestuariimicrobium sp. p3-SID1156]|uniref:cobalt-precorrin-5B (C(1))-methyltransferase n=1 Tax=Aestuariimicrobium sp. p3-SID1156 TaxID=2916038 RepID=UPI00223B714B|nr:cobalt-precorrin-5B (C(1))-methyltransferase [Aestuariimicrobium sp. p3-SID1156]MCT1458625.1 cobalt-precorrin-5B (C(1))-methyltransferase [Aestuariimicrobium sp. p3-SID1156]
MSEPTPPVRGTEPGAAGGRRGQLERSGLRTGWTTGACATAAATAAWQALLTGEFPDPVTVTLPQGRTPSFALTRELLEPGRAMAAVTKDAGDDPDVTHGAVIRVEVRHGLPGSGVVFRGGPGVGRVTLPGLPLAVGEPAINPMPRQMITENLARVSAQRGASCDVVVEISVEEGAELARHTWNPRIGIVDGISILGTTGVVVPYSCSAWIDSIRRGVDVARAAGLQHLAGCTGSTSERVATSLFGLPELALLDMGDFAGAVLKYVSRHPVARLSLVGGFAKLSKLANGHLDLHSHRTRIDTTHLADIAASGGADEALRDQVRASATAMGALQLCLEQGIPLGDLVAARARQEAIAVLKGAPVTVDVVCIDRAGTVVGLSPGA